MKASVFRKRLVLLGAAISIVLAAAVAFLLSTLSATRSASSLTATGLTATWTAPALAVENLLGHSDRLPPAGTQLVRRGGVLEWEVTSESGAPINDFAIQRVQLVSTPPFPFNLLDDDPICKADVEVVVTTTDGQDVRLVIELWEYALLTPWSLETAGDGWKPLQVRWLEE